MSARSGTGAYFTLVACPAACLCALAGCCAPATTAIALRDFQTRYEIIGELGLPLGTGCTVEAEVVWGCLPRDKVDEGRYLLRVLRVNGVALAQPPVMEFVHECGGARDVVQPSRCERYERLHGAKKYGLTEAEAHELDSDYVGRRVVLLVYEYGLFAGMARGLPEKYDWYQCCGWHFRTHLGVLEPADGGGRTHP